jgi:SAM-dependent methyltransferase
LTAKDEPGKVNGTMNNWFENDEFWRAFSPVLFDQSRREAASQEVGSILDLVGGLTGMTVLDMPCGPGRHALELARRGFSVTGVDRTEVYLDEARQNAREAGLNLELVASDMRRFTRPDTYNLALNLFSSLGYFEDPDDDRCLLENFYRSLTDDGVLVIDTMSKEIVAREFEERSVYRIASDLFWVEERKIRPGWD